MADDYYQTLGVPRTAPAEEIKKAGIVVMNEIGIHRSRYVRLPHNAFYSC